MSGLNVNGPELNRQQKGYKMSKKDSKMVDWSKGGRKSKAVALVESAQLKSDVPQFGAGDTVIVQVRVREGNRERLQAFEGLVISKKNRGVNSSFIVRKISNGVGVERTFPIHSPIVEKIEIVSKGDVRRAKLYYQRERIGKRAKIKEKRD